MPVGASGAGGTAASTMFADVANPADAGGLPHLAVAAVAQLGVVPGQHGASGDDGVYLRYRVACHCRARDVFGRLPCRKQRNVGSTTCSNFRVVAPSGIMGVRFVVAPSVPTR
eukprot:10824075-Lingulodinium_polyedra.AAC.1